MVAAPLGRRGGGAVGKAWRRRGGGVAVALTFPPLPLKGAQEEAGSSFLLKWST